MQSLVQDLRYGARMLRKRPGFTIIAVITLALGIGANTAIFSVVNAVVLRPLPYGRADRIVAIQELDKDGNRVQVTPANFLDWRAQNTVFEHLAAILTRQANLAYADQAERIDIAVASANLFSIFDVKPERGRLFLPQDEEAGHPSIVVISYGLWQSRFAGDPELVGKDITLDGKNYTVAGIAPASFQYPGRTQAWLPPLRLAPELNARMDVTQARGFGYLSAVALLNADSSLEQAASEMETITARLRLQYPDTNNRRFNKVVSLHTHLVGNTEAMLWLLLGAVSFVLLIACANVANLLLARAASRQKEMAIRAALGGSRWRIMLQLMTESTMLALAGGAIGMLLAWWGVDLMMKLLPEDFPRWQEINLDWHVLVYTFGASVVTGIVFGFAPALQLSRADVNESLKESGRGAAGSLRQSRLRNLMVAGEVALSLVLLVGAGLLFRSFLQLQSVDTGFTSQNVLTVRLSPSGARYSRDADYIAYYTEAMQRISVIPGVEAVGAINTLPLSKGPTAGYRIEGRPLLTEDNWPGANYRSVSPDYFRAMNISVVQGRAFNERDRESAPLVMMINQALARRDFPNEDPVGKRINLGNTGSNGQPVWFEIVGVAANVRSLELREEPSPDFYLSSLQDPFGGMSIVIRAAVEPGSLTSEVRRAVQELDTSQPLSQMKTMEHIVSDAVTQPRFTLFLFGIFGGIALLLSAGGVYGVTSYTVTQRTHEIGIRVALGAQAGHVLSLIAGQGMKAVTAGILIGIGTSFALTRLLPQLMKDLLFGVSAADPLTFAVIALLLTMVAMAACWLPARRATKVDPLVALRYE